MSMREARRHHGFEVRPSLGFTGKLSNPIADRLPARPQSVGWRHTASRLPSSLVVQQRSESRVHCWAKLESMSYAEFRIAAQANGEIFCGRWVAACYL